MDIKQAAHEETSPLATDLVISRLSCSLKGLEQQIKLRPETMAHRIYDRDLSTEQFTCNYGLNSKYLARIEDGRLHVSGTDSAGDARIVELPGHPFFMATLFQPQITSQSGAPHPLILAFIDAAYQCR